MLFTDDPTWKPDFPPVLSDEQWRHFADRSKLPLEARYNIDNIIGLYQQQLADAETMYPWPNQKKRTAGRVPCATRVMGFEDSTHPLDAFPKPTNSRTNKQQEVAHAVAADDVRLLVDSLDEATKKLIKSPALPGEDRSEVAFSQRPRARHRDSRATMQPLSAEIIVPRCCLGQIA